MKMRNYVAVQEQKTEKNLRTCVVMSKISKCRLNGTSLSHHMARVHVNRPITPCDGELVGRSSVLQQELVYSGQTRTKS